MRHLALVEVLLLAGGCWTLGPVAPPQARLVVRFLNRIAVLNLTTLPTKGP